jgi:hypothetical protein
MLIRMLQLLLPPGVNSTLPLELPNFVLGSWSGQTQNLAGGEPYEVTITLTRDAEEPWSL